MPSNLQSLLQATASAASRPAAAQGRERREPASFAALLPDAREPAPSRPAARPDAPVARPQSRRDDDADTDAPRSGPTRRSDRDRDASAPSVATGNNVTSADQPRTTVTAADRRPDRTEQQADDPVRSDAPAPSDPTPAAADAPEPASDAATAAGQAPVPQPVAVAPSPVSADAPALPDPAPDSAIAGILMTGQGGAPAAVSDPTKADGAVKSPGDKTVGDKSLGDKSLGETSADAPGQTSQDVLQRTDGQTTITAQTAATAPAAAAAGAASVAQAPTATSATDIVEPAAATQAAADIGTSTLPANLRQPAGSPARRLQGQAAAAAAQPGSPASTPVDAGATKVAGDGQGGADAAQAGAAITVPAIASRPGAQALKVADAAGEGAGASGLAEAPQPGTPASAAQAAPAVPVEITVRASGAGHEAGADGETRAAARADAAVLAADLTPAPASGTTVSPSLPAAPFDRSAGPVAASDARAATQQTPVPLTALPIEIGMRALEGARRFDIRLSPDDLGRVDVRLDIADDGTVNAQLVVDRVETLALLQRDAKTLERAFEQAGLRTQEGGVGFSLDTSGEGRRQARQERDEAPVREPATPEQTRTAAGVAAALRAFQSGRSGLDIRI